MQDHRSLCAQIKELRKQNRLKKFRLSTLNEIRPQDLCDTGKTLSPLNCQNNWDLNARDCYVLNDIEEKQYNNLPSLPPEPGHHD